jgi:hypothetical protein
LAQTYAPWLTLAYAAFRSQLNNGLGGLVLWPGPSPPHLRSFPFDRVGVSCCRRRRVGAVGASAPPVAAPGPAPASGAGGDVAPGCRAARRSAALAPPSRQRAAGAAGAASAATSAGALAPQSQRGMVRAGAARRGAARRGAAAPLADAGLMCLSESDEGLCCFDFEGGEGDMFARRGIGMS